MVKINVKGPIVSNSVAWLYNYLGWDCTSPNTISKGLEEANGEDVVLEINSPGGVVVYGYEMYTAIMNYPGKVTAHVICAASAATLLTCACDEALISDAGIFMIHNAQSSADGDYRDMQQSSDMLQEINAGIINAYEKKTKLSREEIQSLMDSNTYMSPQTAIEKGFIDGFMFEQNEPITNIAASNTNIIPESKALELIGLIKGLNNAGTDHMADPINNSQKGEEKMTLKEFLNQNPEAKAEYEKVISTAKEDGVKNERNRIQTLDSIAATVTAEALTDAKYGENPIDGPTLAFQAMQNGQQLAASYMQQAQKDANDSGIDDVGAGSPEESTNESDVLAGYINKSNGGK